MPATEPSRIIGLFASAFNRRSLDELLAFYEPDAVLLVDGSGTRLAGRAAIAEVLRGMLQLPGTMTSRVNFCVVHGDIALLRADWELVGDDGAAIASGSSAEVARRQPDGTWLYILDHAAGASLPRVGLPPSTIPHPS